LRPGVTAMARSRPYARVELEAGMEATCAPSLAEEDSRRARVLWWDKPLSVGGGRQRVERLQDLRGCGTHL